MAVHVGDRGRVVTPLKPGGKVDIDGVEHHARAEYGFVEAGRECVVVRAGLGGLVVRAVEPGFKPSPLPNHGEPVTLAADRRAAIEDEDAEERRAAEHRWAGWNRIGAGAIAAGSLGGMVGLAAAGLGPLFGWVGTDPGDVAILLGCGAAFGVAWAVVLFFALGRLDQRLTRRPEFVPSFGARAGALLGTAVGAWHGFWDGGRPTAVGLAFVGAVGGAAIGWAVSRLTVAVVRWWYE